MVNADVQRRNRRLGWMLGALALVFFAGFIVRMVLSARQGA